MLVSAVQGENGQNTIPGMEGEHQIVPTVALMPWGLLYDEDFLDSIGVSLEAFCHTMNGGFLFNYIDALGRAGIRVSIVFVARGVRSVTRMRHTATGASVLILPPSRFHNLTRQPLVTGGKGVISRIPGARGVLQLLKERLITPDLLMMRELRRAGCAALICQEYEYVRFDTCVRLGRRMGIPVFATFQGGNSADGPIERLVRQKSIDLSAGLIIGASLEIQRVRERYGVSGDKIARIFNPVDAQAFKSGPRDQARSILNIPHDARVVVWYGRVERWTKGLDVLLDAWERLCRSRPDTDLRLQMIGTGKDSEWLRNRLAKPGLRGVHWKDEYIHDRSVLRLHLSAANVFAFPSRHEGFPVAPVEAMASGVPVVAAAAPGIPDIFEGGVGDGGIVVARGDVEQFADALGRLLDEPGLARCMGDAARARAHSAFSLEAVGLQLREFLVRRGMRDEQQMQVGDAS